MRRYGERSRSLIELVRSLASVQRMDDLDAWLRRAVPAFRCEQAYVSVFNADEGYVETTARAGWEPVGDRFWLRDYPRTEEVLAGVEPVIVTVDDPLADPAEADLLRAMHVQSMLMAPLRVFDRPVGLIELYRTTPDPWGDEELELLELVVGQLAAVLAGLEPGASANPRPSGAEEVRARKARERGEQTQRLEALGHLAGAVAHDFNNLLAVILSYAADLEARVEDARLRADVAEISSAAERAARVTGQLLTFSRRRLTEAEWLDPADALRRMESLLRSSMGEHIHVELSLAPVPPLRVNRGHFEQVILNLALNARDAMPRGGVLRVELAGRELAEREDPRLDLIPGPYVLVRVADGGDGMEEWVAARAFDPFFTTKHETHGTGLGLATVHGIVRQAGGDVVLETERGGGTTVTVWFPVPTGAPPEEAVPAVPAAAAPAARAGTVLLVEDNASLRRIVGRMLTGSGYEVLEAVDAAEALATHATAAGGCDMVVSDVRLPGMSGIDLVEQLRERDPQLGAVLMTGSLERAHDASGIPVLHKPFGREELLAALESARR